MARDLSKKDALHHQQQIRHPHRRQSDQAGGVDGFLASWLALTQSGGEKENTAQLELIHDAIESKIVFEIAWDRMFWRPGKCVHSDCPGWQRVSRFEAASFGRRQASSTTKFIPHVLKPAA
jgi:hypothetical protein